MKIFKCQCACLFILVIAIGFTSSARLLDEDTEVAPTNAVTPLVGVPPAATSTDETPPVVAPVTPQPVVASTTPINNADHQLSFFMHDILGGSNPSAQPVTGIISNAAANGQIPFAKPNGGVFPQNNGVSLPNSNNPNAGSNVNNAALLPFLTGLGGGNQVQNNIGVNGGNVLPFVNGGQLPAETNIQKLEFGTLTVIDDELTEGHEAGGTVLGKAQGFYVTSSEDGSSQTMAFTAMFENGGYVDTVNFFGVHRTAVSESQIAVMGGTGKYHTASGYATVKIVPSLNQHNTDGVETVLQFTVYLSY